MCSEIVADAPKPVQTGGAMYRKKSHEQVEFKSFHLSFGGRLRSDNRWVKLSKIVPWEQIERRYTVRLNEDRGAPT